MSLKVTSTTSSGRTQWLPRVFGAPATSSRAPASSSGSSTFRISLSLASE